MKLFEYFILIGFYTSAVFVFFILLHRYYNYFKRIIDVFLSLFILILVSHIIIIIAILIKLSSPGPVFVFSKRVGKGFSMFGMLLFRTFSMPKKGKQSKIFWFGRILINTKVYKLPVILNILMGDMSFVGNKPLMLRDAENLRSDAWALRFESPVGIFGHWHNMAINNNLTLNLYNIDHCYRTPESIFNDLKIIYYSIYYSNISSLAKNKTIYDSKKLDIDNIIVKILEIDNYEPQEINRINLKIKEELSNQVMEDVWI